MSESASDPAEERLDEAEPVPQVPVRRYAPPPRLRRYLRRLLTVPGSTEFRER